jgi:hypothetical protein
MAREDAGVGEEGDLGPDAQTRELLADPARAPGATTMR